MVKEVALLLVPILGGHEIIVLPLAATTAVIAVHRGMHLLCEGYEVAPPSRESPNLPGDS